MSDSETDSEMASPSEAVPLTAEHLNMKDIKDSLDESRRQDLVDSQHPIAGTTRDGSDERVPLEDVSIASTRGSEVPTPSIGSTSGVEVSTCFAPATEAPCPAQPSLRKFELP